MNNDRFIKHLRSLPYLAHFDSGLIAAYRRACGQRLAASRGCQEFFNHLVLPVDFLTVTLVAQYPTDKIARNEHHKSYGNKGSIGAAWAAYCRYRNVEEDPHTFYRRRQEALERGSDPPNVPSVHERFRTVLDAELELDGTGELAYRLRGLIRMLVAEDIPIDAIQLARDLRGWRSASRAVQERWAKAFYAPPKVSSTTGAQEESETIDHELEKESKEEEEEEENVD